MSKRFLVTLLAIALALVGIFWLTQDKAGAPTNDGSSTTQNQKHTQGAGNKGVTLVEFGDFECPACGAYYPILQQIKQKFGDDITFEFRHFPLSNIHPNAFAAHRAAEAAGNQGKFFEMHDLLYEKQREWAGKSNAARTFEGYAQSLNLDMEKYKADVASSKTNSIINADIKTGQEIGADSTPTFVLNGKKLDQPPRDLESFIKLIDEAIAEKGKSNP